MFSADSRIFIFLFSVLLFNSTENEETIQNVVEEQLNFMHLLQRYFLIKSDGDYPKTAISLGTANEIISYFQNELND